jgi:integrase/recombinase XerC
MPQSNSLHANNRQNQTGPPTLTVLESHQLLDNLLPKTGTSKQLRRGVRNYCIALLMLDAGLRVGEVVGLLQSDIIFSEQIVQSLCLRAEITKYKIERTLPLSSRLKSAFEEMRNRIWSNTKPEPAHYAFYLHDPQYPLTTRQVQRMIEKASLKAIGRRIHPHVLRHTFATRLMKVLDIRGVQQLLGHKQLSSTQVYTHPSSDDMKKAVDRVSTETTI